MREFRQQVGAVILKNATAQRRSLVVNTCLLALPVVFCGLLFGIQVAINSQLDSREFKCGCKCLECCEWLEGASRTTRLKPGVRALMAMLWRLGDCCV